ncbi:uncharacterized protein EV420DRAFT_1514683 [Desarmillaria tabescens]|uniref:Uncharacterized protein n=1 Tax=Armillaria tabescens TaxID=1929756 RepID=A0AA39NH27_ARMTA|nr:uncharacterized protein EV420DRAFT_1514683 [Desarmillaria tabescens]KAK0465512.1 hypothetical protein EV420DRAFT_1514683 [Desarmillaria tabescens]
MSDADYLTVSKPYPLNFEWDQDKDIIKHVRWIAACIDSPRQFYAFHYKPSAPSMIIVEIEKNCSKKRETLLGEHRWKEFLLAPSEEEREYISQIFPCLHSTDLALRNDGWHRVSVRPDWFKGWSRTQCKDIMHPYPTTHYCTPPFVDPLNRSLCRPLPHSFLKFRKTLKPDAKRPPGENIPNAQGERVQNRGDPAHPPGLPPQDQTNTSDAPKEDEDEYEPVENIWEQITEPSQTLPLCPTHNRVCKKAICDTYYKLLRNIDNEKKNAEKKKKINEKKKEKNEKRKRDARLKRSGKDVKEKVDNKDIGGDDENLATWNSSSWGDKGGQDWAGDGGKSDCKSPSPVPPVLVEEEEEDPWA